jgi:serine/threonine protein kinase
VTPEQWRRVKEVFEAALDHAPEERSAFLAQDCGDDVLLCSEVQSLLRSYEQEKGFMETPAVALAAQSLVEQERAALVGRQLGHYRIIRELGRGGMGVVYLAQDVSLDRPVALKLLPIHLTSEPERLHRFEQEARAASALNHPNILTIHEIGEIDGLRFIETEFIDGVTLRERIKSRELKPSDTLSIAEQIASALAAAHKAGIVHRDIKPENVMLRRDGYVKVLDFGVAKLTEEQAVKVDNGSAMTLGVNSNTGIVGTAGYMSPEQAKGKHVDQRSDIFSFGAVLYEMLTGEMAFQGKSDADKLQAITSEWPADLSGLRESVPADLDQVLQRCLEKEPEHRYENGTVLVEALKELGAPWRSTAEVPVSGRASWTGSNRWWWMVLAGMALIISVSLWLRIPGGSPGKMSNQAAEALSRDLTTIPLTGLPALRGFLNSRQMTGMLLTLGKLKAVITKKSTLS